jgi:hypothetical protein
MSRPPPRSAQVGADGFFSPHGGYRLVGFLLFFVWMLLAAIFMLVRPTAEENPVAVPTTT